jgi:hypothetical protein
MRIETKLGGLIFAPGVILFMLRGNPPTGYLFSSLIFGFADFQVHICVSRSNLSFPSNIFDGMFNPALDAQMIDAPGQKGLSRLANLEPKARILAE